MEFTKTGNFRMKRIIWTFTLIFISSNVYAWDYKCERQKTSEGNLQLCRTFEPIIRRSKATDKKMYIYIHFNALNGKIKPHSVCTSYDKKSIAGRFCLTKANEMFRDLCYEDSHRSKPFCDVKDKVHPLM